MESKPVSTASDDLHGYNVIMVTRLYRQNNHVQQFGTEVVDAILDFMANCPNASRVVLSGGRYLPSAKEPFAVDGSVTDDNAIMARVKDLRMHGSTSEPESIIVELFSRARGVADIKKWIEQAQEDYQQELNTQLGKKLYFLDMVPHKEELPARFDQSGGFCIRQHQSMLLFEKKPFNTTRSFDNIFFPDKERLVKRLDFFLNKKDWYLQRGVQHTLGFLFHGPPGTGKSSTLKAIANLTKRHVINVSLKNVRTRTQLKNLLFDDRLTILKSPDDQTSRETFQIPIDRRLYVFEDVDAVEGGDLGYLLERQTKAEAATTKPPRTRRKTAATAPVTEDSMFSMLGSEQSAPEETIPIIDDPTEKIDLSTFLNLLDGVLEAEGRIMAFTTNYPERLDKALLRQGRIDVVVQFGLATKATAQEMIESFYETACTADELEGFIQNKLSPARITSILFQHFDERARAVTEIILESRE